MRKIGFNFKESKSKKELGPTLIDGVRKVRQKNKDPLDNNSKRWCFFSVKNLKIAILLFFLANLSFWGTVAFQNIKTKTGILSLFKEGKYLILLQNNAELRPTGGFIGSFALINFENYRVKNIEFNTNIYKMDNAYTSKNTVVPPAPLASITLGKWAMRDANFFVDYPESAQKVIWFYKEESGEDVDGVISINASVIRDLLKVIGPVIMDQYKSTITSENFFDELFKEVEQDYFKDQENWKVNEPKSILKDMMPIVIERSKNSKIKALKLVYDSLSQKQILLYSEKQHVQKAIQNLNWGGKIKESYVDYLQINHLNSADNTNDPLVGGKTSLKVKELINYDVEKNASNYKSNLVITRSHSGNYGWPDGTNQNWTRVLVPLGSNLEKVEIDGREITGNVEIGTEAGKTYFGFWQTTAPQSTSKIHLVYSFPIKLNEKYTLLFQKQSGILENELKIKVENRIIYQGIVKKDRFFRD